MTYALRRVLLTIPLLLAVSLAVFALTDAVPGDPAASRFPKHPQLAEEWREGRGLNDPFLLRWALEHKATFLLLPAMIVVAGCMVWRGFDDLFAWMPSKLQESEPATFLA